MWFLGAGASASAGLPTAADMISEFKRRLFVSRKLRGVQHDVDLSQPAVRHRIDAYVESLENIPSAGDPDEYAKLFEVTYPAESDRQAFLDGKVAGAKPSYGHVALATLMREGLTRLLWTTNFDALIEDACAEVFGTTSGLTTVTLDSGQLTQAIADERRPVQIKMHGDFRSRRLKNTNDELRHQDAHLRNVLIDSCLRFGLVVIGYSGRDDSIMDALEDAVSRANAFPSGLFWLHRGDGEPSSRVIQLLSLGKSKEVDVALVSIENFDETLRDVVHILGEIDTQTLDDFAKTRSHRSPAPTLNLRGRNNGWPVVRLNALPVSVVPTQCRIVECEIGGTVEVREAVRKAGVDVVAVRSGSGVLAFGADADVRSAFEPFGITRFDLHPLEDRRQRYESTERGLLHEVLARAISRRCGLKIMDKRGRKLAPSDLADAVWNPLRSLVQTMSGVVTGHPDLKWREGVEIRLDWANDRMWLLIEPKTIFDGLDDGNKTVAADFARERSIRRYNRQLNDLIDFWAKHLASGGNELRALDVRSGVDAIFRISVDTAFSRRIRS